MCIKFGKDSIKTEETLNVLDPVIADKAQTQDPVENLIDNEELREEYDQYNDDPSYNTQQREYYNQR